MYDQKFPVKEKVIQYAAAHEYLSEEGCFINELSNDHADAAVSIAQARVSPGEATVWHLLRGVVERYVVLSGTGVVEVGESPPTAVAVGDVVIVPAGCRQRISNTGHDDLIFLCICTPRFEWQFYERLKA
jgi:mannose-6-phosphate isomerase-like protein (cupin superfamily)